MGYPPGMPFSEDELGLIDRTEEVEIETVAADRIDHRAIIWAIVDDGEVFIRSYVGPTAKWYLRVLTNPSIVLIVAGKRLHAEARPAADGASIERASAGFLRKYPGDPATPRMNRPEVLDLTLRLERA